MVTSDLKRGGVLVRLDGAVWFVPATVALAITAAPQIARVPGAPEALLGAALHEGEVVPVVAIGSARSSMLVCSYLGEKIGLLGARVEATGLFDPDPTAADAVRHKGETARALDLGAIYARIQGEGWAGRWRA
jgi:hypothetical protein